MAGLKKNPINPKTLNPKAPRTPNSMQEPADFHGAFEPQGSDHVRACAREEDRLEDEDLIFRSRV